ncbi:MAG: chemotaxis protein CheC [Thermoguttaceae bacterium]|nr:chemotaxis protein CheC [Thermoguttaceae bacterium]MDW8038804.1 chemotaxis protein CheC [Thermoguttaceae bacterium]
MSSTSVQSERLRILHELLAAATHEASATMSRWTNGLITLSLDEVRELQLEEVIAGLDLDDQLLTMVVLSLEGPLSGEMILTFDEHNARQLAAALLDRPVASEGEWTELEKSALTETGNILACSYISALSRLIGEDLMPMPPYFLQDYGASVLQQALLSQAMAGDQILVCRTGFHRHGEDLNWRVLFVPNYALREAMEKAIRTSE